MAEIDPSALSRLDDEDIVAGLPPYPITSLRRIQSLYGRLDYLVRGVTDFKGYAAYLTPDSVDDLIDNPNSLLVVKVDLTTDEPIYEGIEFRTYTEDVVSDIGYSYYYASKGHDFSLTHKTNNKKSSTVAGWAKQGFTNWPVPHETPEFPEETLEHPDAFALDRLATLGQDEDELAQLEADIEALLPYHDGLLITVELRVDLEEFVEPPSDKSGVAEVYPGEIAVCNEVMKESRVLGGFATKSYVDGISRGTGHCQVSGDSATLVGLAEDPLRHYTAKQREKFRGLDHETAWQIHPVSGDEAMYVARSSDFVEACYANMGLHRVYHLPYFVGGQTPERVRILYTLLTELKKQRENEDDGNEPTLTVIRRIAAETNVSLDDLRFWVVAQHYDQKDRRNVFGERPAARSHAVERLAEKHIEVIESLFGTYGHSRSDNENALTASIDLKHAQRTIESGWYVRRTFPVIAAGTETDSSPATDDTKIEAYLRLLTNQPIETGHLLRGYMHRLADDYDGNVYALADRVTDQVAQLRTLALAGLLQASDDTQETLTIPPTMNNEYDPTAASDDVESFLVNENEPTDSDVAAYRSERIDRYLGKNRSIDDEPNRKAAFLLGVITGHLSRYQAGAEGMNRTLAVQYPPHEFTRERATRLYSELTGKSLQYSRGGFLYSDLMERLGDASLPATGEWEISLVDMQFHYADGLVFALTFDKENAPASPNNESTDD
jgi:hypothetical protein